METKVEGHHFLIGILVAWVAIVLYQQNILGLPSIVASLVRTVTSLIAPVTGSINLGQITGTTTSSSS